MLCGGPVVYWKLLTIKIQYFDNFFKICTDTFYEQCHIFFITIYLLQGHFKCLVPYVAGSVSCVFYQIIKINVQLATSGPSEIWQDHQISRAGGPMIHCLEIVISSPAQLRHPASPCGHDQVGDLS